jgi:multidrug efflux pump subunit AcrA (membrane-fusion protein)
LPAAALCACSGKEAAPPPPPEVVVTEAVQKDVPVYMELVGQTKGSQDVEIRARVEGYLDRFFFTEGAFVRKGDRLYQIDPKPFESAVAQARADLATVQARLDQTTITVNRLKPLVAQKAVSQQELDNALANQDAARAQVDASRAKLDNATLDLGYTSIASPIDGIAGTTLVKAGNLVGRGEHRHGLASGPDTLSGRDQRGGVPPDRAPGRRAARGPGRRTDHRSTAPSRRHHPPARRAVEVVGAQWTPPPAHSPCSSPFRTPTDF